MNIDTVTAIREQGGDIVYGDASQREILRHAGIEYAESLILSASIPDAKEIVGVALELNPHIDVMIHTKYMRDVDILKEAGRFPGFFLGIGSSPCPWRNISCGKAVRTTNRSFPSASAFARSWTGKCPEFPLRAIHNRWLRFVRAEVPMPGMETRFSFPNSEHVFTGIRQQSFNFCSAWTV